MKGEIEREIETKLDVPLEVPQDQAIEEIRRILETDGWRVASERNDQKDLLYYDTSDFRLHQEGSTLRRVTPFDSGKFPGSVRYDFKEGKGDKRVESKEWSNRFLNEKEIRALLGLEKRFEFISPVAFVHITPRFLDIVSGCTEVELKLDTCSYSGKSLFRELELELRRGEPERVYSTSDLIVKRLGLRYLTQQKYSRVVEILGRGK